MKLVINVTDDTSTASADAGRLTGGSLAGGSLGSGSLGSGSLAGGAAQAGGDGGIQVFDGGAMPELLSAMAEEVEAGRMPPPGPSR